MKTKILSSTILVLTISLAGCGDKSEKVKTDEKKQEEVTKIGSVASHGSNPESTESEYTINEKIALSVSGAGASFPALVYKSWAKQYEAETNGKVSYESIGSSAGLRAINNKIVDFGASDRPLMPNELKKKNLIQFPTVIGGIVPIVNLEGIKSGELVLDSQTLAKIYLGKISKWNHSAIKKLNPSLELPNQKITTVFRSDGSGSTYNFSYYLNQVAPQWSSVGVGKTLKWPTANEGSGYGTEGSTALAKKVQEVSGSIGYIDYSYAKENKLTYTAMVNAAGKTVEPSQKSFAAAGDINWADYPGFYKLITNAESKDAWPIATTTFIMINKNPKNPEQVAGVLNFFNWAYMKGYQNALDLDFVPFSDKPVAVFFKEWNKIVDEDGQPVYQVHSTI